MQNRTFYRSLDHVNWWDPAHWKTKRSLSSASLTGADPGEIRNGWLTLTNYKARFQQKQLQERELKIASLYEAQQARALDRVRHSPANGNLANGNLVNGNLVNGNLANGNVANGNLTSGVEPLASPAAPIPHHPGKVRQMFEERRTKAGIDKSYPLQPIHNNADRTRKAHMTKTTSSRVEQTKVQTKTHSVRKHAVVKTEKVVNGAGDLNHNHVPDSNGNSDKMPPQNIGEPNRHVPQDTNEPVGLDELDRAVSLIENETFPEAMAPEPTPRSPEPKRPPRRSPATRSSPVPKSTAASKSTPAVKSSPAKKPAAVVTPPRKAASDNTVSHEKPRGAMQRASNPAPPVKKSPITLPGSKPTSSRGLPRGGASAASGATDGVPCAVCGRRFAADRLDKHQDICKRSNTKKRKPFDALKHRLAGTEAEPFITKLRKGTSNQKTKPLNSTWRQKHEDFINAIRAAKQVQAHLNAGGKLSDLPPPPPSENPDYIQCPHCQRKFNQAAAERHIPKCASYSFNKPKPGQGPARKR